MLPALEPVTLEPHTRNWLLMLDRPGVLPEDALLSHDMQVLSKRPVRMRMRYDGGSVFSYVLDRELSDVEREMALSITEAEKRRSTALAGPGAAEGTIPQQMGQSAVNSCRTIALVEPLHQPLIRPATT